MSSCHCTCKENSLSREIPHFVFQPNSWKDLEVSDVNIFPDFLVWYLYIYFLSVFPRTSIILLPIVHCPSHVTISMLPLGVYNSFRHILVARTYNRFYTFLTYLLHGAEPLLRSWLVLQLVKKFPAFLEPEGFSPYPQATATCPYHEPTPSSPHHPLPLPEDPS